MSEYTKVNHGVTELLAGCSCLLCLRRAWHCEVRGELIVPAGQKRGVGQWSHVRERRQTEAETRVARRLIRGLAVRRAQ